MLHGYSSIYTSYRFSAVLGVSRALTANKRQAKKVTTGHKIALASLIATIVIAIVGGGWAVYTWWRRNTPHGSEPTPLTPAHIDGGSAASSESRVSWQIEHLSGARYALCNTGTVNAEQVHVDKSRAPAINRGLPEGRAVLAHDAVDIMLKGSWQSPMPSSLYLRWDGHPEWFAVAIA